MSDPYFIWIMHAARDMTWTNRFGFFWLTTTTYSRYSFANSPPRPPRSCQSFPHLLHLQFLVCFPCSVASPRPFGRFNALTGFKRLPRAFNLPLLFIVPPLRILRRP